MLGAMEAGETDDEDRPHEEIKILKTSVFLDPFKEAEEEVCLYVSLRVFTSVSHTASCRGGEGKGGGRR